VLTVAPASPESRRWDPASAAEQAGVSGSVRIIPDFAAALRRAETMAPHGTVLVTGSVHTVGDALLELGVPAY
jgi:folylpolyglutamate synthase/dihydropteroate synthase